MARIIDKPISVTAGRLDGYDRAPRSFMYEREKHVVKAVQDHWLEAGRWWEQETEKETWRVITAKDGVFELMHDRVTKRWILYKAYD